MQDSRLIVSEIFGPTIQGEGSSVGTPAMFLRLGICNLACTWCDTKYSWDWKKYDYKKELTRMSTEDIVSDLHRRGGWSSSFLVISGGEPMLQQHKVAQLLRGDLQGWRVEIETAGTIPVEAQSLRRRVDQFNVSPKLYNSGNSLKSRLVPKALESFPKDRTIWKFVVQKNGDLEEVDQIVKQFSVASNKVYISPEGVTAQEVRERSSAIVEGVIARGWRMNSRLHLVIWGDKKGH